MRSTETDTNTHTFNLGQVPAVWEGGVGKRLSQHQGNLRETAASPASWAVLTATFSPASWTCLPCFALTTLAWKNPDWQAVSMQTLQGTCGKVSAVALTSLATPSLLASLLPHHFWVFFALYLLFKLLFHCRVARYGCVDWARMELLTWAPVWMRCPGQPWNCMSYTTDCTHAEVSSDSFHTAHAPWAIALTLNCFLFAPFWTFISHPDFSGPRPPLQSYFMPPSPLPGCS